MMTLVPADRARLAKFLGLLGSDHPGERDAAGLAADRFVRAKGLTWADVLEQHGAACATPAPAQSWPGNYEDPAAIDLRTCGRRPDLLTPWETAFVGEMAQRMPRKFSAKQRSILVDIAAKVRAAGPRAG